MELNFPVVDMPSWMFVPRAQFAHYIRKHNCNEVIYPVFLAFNAVEHGYGAIQTIHRVFGEMQEIMQMLAHEPVMLPPSFVIGIAAVLVHKDCP